MVVPDEPEEQKQPDEQKCLQPCAGDVCTDRKSPLVSLCVLLLT